MSDSTPWEWCRCSDSDEWRCGCGRHTVYIWDALFHWRGRHWRVRCALEAVAQELEQTSAALRELVELHDRTKHKDPAAYEARKPAAWAEARRVLGEATR